ncbi:hypothetical protein JKP88DRAFT_280288 [Tribonema minus]|uniref:Uncharacterized protein n=1 Tax=Tribonema minus TaxID=303371 RepID=A0A835YPU8_9STRA|nr:hypothetical protein JKP88DRAFT_280288 [Tribonema minus]
MTVTAKWLTAKWQEPQVTWTGDRPHRALLTALLAQLGAAGAAAQRAPWRRASSPHVTQIDNVQFTDSRIQSIRDSYIDHVKGQKRDMIERLEEVDRQRTAEAAATAAVEDAAVDADTA